MPSRARRPAIWSHHHILPYGIFLHPPTGTSTFASADRPPAPGLGRVGVNRLPITSTKPSRSTGLLGATWLASLPYPVAGLRLSLSTHHATTYPSSLGEQAQGLREPRLTAVVAVA